MSRNRALAAISSFPKVTPTLSNSISLQSLIHSNKIITLLKSFSSFAAERTHFYNDTHLPSNSSQYQYDPHVHHQPPPTDRFYTQPHNPTSAGNSQIRKDGTFSNGYSQNSNNEVYGGGSRNFNDSQQNSNYRGNLTEGHSQNSNGNFGGGAGGGYIHPPQIHPMGSSTNSMWDQGRSLGVQGNQSGAFPSNAVGDFNLNRNAHQLPPSSNGNFQQNMDGCYRSTHGNGYQVQSNSNVYHREDAGNIQQKPNGYQFQPRDGGNFQQKPNGYQSQSNTNGYDREDSVNFQQRPNGHQFQPNSNGYHREGSGSFQQNSNVYQFQPNSSGNHDNGSYQQKPNGYQFPPNSNGYDREEIGNFQQRPNGYQFQPNSNGYHREGSESFQQNSNVYQFQPNSSGYHDSGNHQQKPNRYQFHPNSNGYNREDSGNFQQNPIGSSHNTVLEFSKNTNANQTSGIQQNWLQGGAGNFPTPIHATTDSGSAEIAESSPYAGTIEELDGFCQENKMKEAVEVLELLEKKGVTVDLLRYVKLVEACGDVGVLKYAKYVHDQLIKSTGHIELNTQNKILEMYSKCGSMSDAYEIFEKMSERNLTSWDTMITGLAKNGLGEDAVDLFTQFKEAGQKPDGQMFIGLFSACSVLGDINEGMLHFESMQTRYGIVPSMEHYVSVVNMLGSAGYLDEAMDFIEDMPIEPNVDVWETLMNLCRVHGNMELGDQCAEIVNHLDPSHLTDKSKEGLLPVKASKLLEERERRNSSINLSEVKNSRVHEYRAGDTSHPDNHILYTLLKRMSAQMKEAGYVPDIKPVLHDVDQETKEEALLSHSERLAVAQGLITSTPRSPIRVIKNLRICMDCHNSMKIISKIVGRELIMRDAKRFHHFKDGLCSCKDYW